MMTFAPLASELTAKLIEPLGFTTLVLLVTTVVLGFLRRSRPGLLPWHKRIGPLTLIVALVHLTMVMLSHSH